MSSYTFGAQDEAILRTLLKRRLRETIREGREPQRYVVGCARLLEKLAANESPNRATATALKQAYEYEGPRF